MDSQLFKLYKYVTILTYELILSSFYRLIYEFNKIINN